MICAFVGVAALFVLIENGSEERIWGPLWMVCQLGLALLTGIVVFSESKGWDEKRGWLLQGLGLAALAGYSWPGNVRELKNVIERAVLIATEGVITREHVLLDPHELEGESLLADPDDPTQVFQRPKEVTGEDTQDERQRLIRALEECGGNQTRAAKLLGISRRTLINRIEQWQLPRPKKR